MTPDTSPLAWNWEKSAAAWRAVWDAVVSLCCVWACPLAGAVGIWLAFVGVRRVLDRGLGGVR